MLSIDQNCSSLWDVLPKLHVLGRHGKAPRQLVEDIDVAFTALGATVDSLQLRLAQERYYRTGAADWGAALFYSEFLGRQPLDIRRLEEFTGLKTDVLARQLGRSVDSLFEEFSPGDNWQLIGSSYVSDRRHHRLIGDLGVPQVSPHLRQLLRLARQDMTRAFPDAASQRRTTDWFGREEAFLEPMLCASGQMPLVELYRRWLGRHLDSSVQLGNSSQFFDLGEGAGRDNLVELFLRRYDQAGHLYNQAVQHTELRPLKLEQGELPFFAAMQYHGHQVRTPMSLRPGKLVLDDLEIALGPDGSLPTEALRRAGVCCLVGKAILMVMQVRLDPRGQELALPYRGSGYMPISYRLEDLLRREGLLPGPLKPVVRVRLRLLDRLRELDASIRLPEYLAGHFGQEVIPARRLGENWSDLQAQAHRHLESCRDGHYRRRWQRQAFPELTAQIDQLDLARRQLAAQSERPDPPTIRGMWKEVKALQVKLLDATFRQIWRDWQVSQLDYWDSRGAILPWCVALGGEDFYNHVVAGAEVYCEEPQAEFPA